MSSPITLSGFNNVDFSQILTLVMAQESRPLQSLQSRQSALQARANTFNQLTAKVSALQSAADWLATGTNLSANAATSSDPATLTAAATDTAVPGRYEVTVGTLARAQVSVSATVAPDADSTVVATGGTLTISGVTVSLSGAVTLRGLADAINATSDPPARAAVVQSGPGSYRLVLTAKETGTAGAFTIEGNLGGGGDSGFDNAFTTAVAATDAQVQVNGISVTSTTNTVTDAIPGVTLNLLKLNTTNGVPSPVTVEVKRDTESLKARARTFVTQYNDLMKFASDQTLAARNGSQASIGREPLLRQLRDQLRDAVVSEYGSGAVTSLSQVGFSLSKTGTLELNEAAFDAAVTASATDVAALFAGASGGPGSSGVFGEIKTTLDTYTSSEGLLRGATKLLNEQTSRLTEQLTSMESRLALRRAALQREFIAADQAMSQLKSQSSSLASFGGSL